MKNRKYYERSFKAYPDLVTLLEVKKCSEILQKEL